MKWIKAIVAGLVAGLVMFIALAIGTNTGMAPINVPPSAAFLGATTNIRSPPLAGLLHFAYAAFGSVLLVAIFGRDTNITKGIGLALVLWLILMMVFSPIIGWGFFGAGGPNHELPPTAPLYIGSAGAYVLVSLMLHVVYGLIIGWMDKAWIDWSGDVRSAESVRVNQETGQR